MWLGPPVVTWNRFVITAIVYLVLTSLFVVMRMYTKLILLKSRGWDDCESSSFVDRVRILSWNRYLCLGMGRDSGLS
jgi:hypothetical protein